MCGVSAGVAFDLLLFGLEVGCFFTILFLHEVAVPAAKVQAGSLIRFFRKEVSDGAAAGAAGAGAAGGGNADVAFSEVGCRLQGGM